MFNLQAHKGYFPIVNVRLFIKPINNQAAAIGFKFSRFSTACNFYDEWGLDISVLSATFLLKLLKNQSRKITIL